MLTRSHKRINDYFTNDGENQPNNNDKNTEDDDNLQPSAKRRKTRIPLILDGKYFSIESNIDGNIIARCTECNEQKKGSLTSTGNFKSHFRMKHLEILPTVEAYLKSKGAETSIGVAQPTLERFVFKPEKVNETRIFCSFDYFRRTFKLLLVN